MAGFMIRFLLSNMLLAGIISIFLFVKRILRGKLTGRMQYNLWFVLLGLLAVPFLPVRLSGGYSLFSLLESLGSPRASDAGNVIKHAADIRKSGGTAWMDDLALSVSRRAPSQAGLFLFVIWSAGMAVMVILLARAVYRLHVVKKTALPLQNKEIEIVYRSCLEDMHLKKEIPVCSTGYLKSPMIAGLFRPCIFLPRHLLSKDDRTELRHMLLHELQHYRHRDALANYWMNLAGIVYWFHPFVWYALREMRNDREIACDLSVLQLLGEEQKEAYGNTLINYAEKVSLAPFPSASGMSGTMRQLKRRITSIAVYEKPSGRKKAESVAVFAVIAALLTGTAPVLAACVSNDTDYRWPVKTEQVTYVDLSFEFQGYEGSFVLYDLETDAWKVFDLDHAVRRVPPDSTYKIYDALFGLEEGVVTTEDSLIRWDGTKHPFEAWNRDQTLETAMESSVNWYFQTIDDRLGASVVQSYLQKTAYGNEDITEAFPTHWLEASLKISPVEQVQLLTKLYRNEFRFSPENIAAVKEAILLSSSEGKKLYGKTGTGRVDGKDVNGWFVGYIEEAGNTRFFAVNIQGEDHATGSKAAKIAEAVLEQPAFAGGP